MTKKKLGWGEQPFPRERLTGALKRLYWEDKDTVVATIEWMEDGETISGDFSLFIWNWAPRELRKQAEKALSKPPVAIFRSRRPGR